jgi:carboxyl-terminal processing protease
MMRRSLSGSCWLAILVLVLAGGLFSSLTVRLQADDSPAKLDKSADSKELPYQAAPFARRLWIITDTVLEHHVDPPTRQEMFLAGLKGLFAAAHTDPPANLSRRVSALTTEDQFAALLQENWPHEGQAPVKELESAVLGGLLKCVPGEPDLISPEGLRILRQSLANRYVGTGIQVHNSPEGWVQILVPFAGGPARRAGAKPGDLILEVDGASMKGLTLGQVVDKLRGDEGTSVTCTVQQPGAKETRLLSMKREVVPFRTVMGYRRTGEETWTYRVDPDVPIAYVRLTSLGSSTLHEMRKLEGQLLSDGIRGVVLDLRENSGGELHEAALLADSLLDGGLMWRLRDSHQKVKEYQADRECLFRDCPLAVLVDPFTSGTAELVAAALQDNKRAVLVGVPTHGDGCVTSLVDLPENLGALQLRTSQVERAVPPRQKEAQDSEERRAGTRLSVQPDHLVTMSKEQIDAMMQWAHEQESPEPPPGALTQPPADSQLDKAVALLREALKASDKSP